MTGAGDAACESESRQGALRKGGRPACPDLRRRQATVCGLPLRRSGARNGVVPAVVVKRRSQWQPRRRPAKSSGGRDRAGGESTGLRFISKSPSFSSTSQASSICYRELVISACITLLFCSVCQYPHDWDCRVFSMAAPPLTEQPAALARSAATLDDLPAWWDGATAVTATR